MFKFRKEATEGAGHIAKDVRFPVSLEPEADFLFFPDQNPLFHLLPVQR